MRNSYFEEKTETARKVAEYTRARALPQTNGEAEYTCKTAANIKEATELIEAGYQYVTTIEGIQLFKKRK